MSDKKNRNRFTLILILGLLSAIGPFSIDMYLPGFPAIARDLNTTVAHISLSLSSFFIGISAGQLIYEPLLDRFGRKKPLYVGLSLYLISSLGCAIAPSADALIALRLLQALGACAGMVASRAMVRDLFPVHESAKVFSLLMLVIGVSPIIAPTLGGYITTHFHWHYVFVVLTLMAAIILSGVYFFLPESKRPDKSFSLMPGPITANFLSVLREPQFYTYAFTGAIASAGLYAYISGSPYVFMEIFHVTQQQYGWIFAIVAIGLILSSQLNTLLLKRFSSRQLIRWALLCQSVTGLALFIGTLFNQLGLYSMIALIFVFLCCQGFSFPNASALSLAPFSNNAGTASALMGAIQMGLGALTSASVSLLSNHTALPMTAVMSACALISFTILMLGGRIITRRERNEDVSEQSVELVKEF